MSTMSASRPTASAPLTCAMTEERRRIVGEQPRGVREGQPALVESLQQQRIERLETGTPEAFFSMFGSVLRSSDQLT